MPNPEVRHSRLRNSLDYSTLVVTRLSQHKAGLAEAEPQVALMAKISVRRAWGACKLVAGETTRKSPAEDKQAAADSDSDGEMDTSARRAALGEFRKRHRYSAPMHHQQAGGLFARMSRRHEKRLLHCHNLKDVACILDQEMPFRSNQLVRTRTLAQDKVVTTQGSVLKLKKPLKINQYNRCHASFLSFLTFESNPLVRIQT